MKREVNCSIVQDLLPNYIENLTSEETNQIVEGHLKSCIECKHMYEQMVADIERTVEIPPREFRFLKKVKRTRMLAAALCVIIMLLLSSYLYTMEFKYTIDKTNLSSAITEFMSPFDGEVEAYVLETKEINGTLLASFKDRNHEYVNGIAKFTKGMNQKYRIVQTKIESSEYSAVVQFYPIEIKDKRYIAVSGYNLSNEIKYYGLDYSTYANPGQLSEDRVQESVKFEVENQQFIEVYKSEEIESLLLKSVERNLHSFYLVKTSVYDENSIEITENFRIPDEGRKNIAYGVGKVELFLLYVYIAIVLCFGILMVRYFLTE